MERIECIAGRIYGCTAGHIPYSTAHSHRCPSGMGEPDTFRFAEHGEHVPRSFTSFRHRSQLYIQSLHECPPSKAGRLMTVRFTSERQFVLQYVRRMRPLSMQGVRVLVSAIMVVLLLFSFGTAQAENATGLLASDAPSNIGSLSAGPLRVLYLGERSFTAAVCAAVAEKMETDHRVFVTSSRDHFPEDGSDSARSALHGTHCYGLGCRLA